MQLLLRNGKENVCYHVEREENEYRCQDEQVFLISEQLVINICDISEEDFYGSN